jgi:hypothetical protein
MQCIEGFEMGKWIPSNKRPTSDLPVTGETWDKNATDTSSGIQPTNDVLVQSV